MIIIIIILVYNNYNIGGVYNNLRGQYVPSNIQSHQQWCLIREQQMTDGKDNEKITERWEAGQYGGK